MTQFDSQENPINGVNMPTIEAECLYFGIVPKPGEDETNCQDACSVNKENSRFAIADGVTKSFLPAEWAQLLVEGFTTDHAERIDELFDTRNWKDWLSPIQVQWENRAKEVVSKLRESKHVYMRNQLATREPAASTFIGLRKKPNSNGHIWQIMIIGDSCLFHITKDNKIFSYLLSAKSQFDSRPQAFVSYKEKTVGGPEFLEINVQAGDRILLATDALSKWLLSVKERGKNVYTATINVLTSYKSKEELLKFVEFERADKVFQLESDDIGIITLSFRKLAEEAKDSQNTWGSDDPLPNSSVKIPRHVISGSQIQGQNQFQKDKHTKASPNLINKSTQLKSNNLILIKLFLGIAATISVVGAGYWYYTTNYVRSQSDTPAHSQNIIRAGDTVFYGPNLESLTVFNVMKDFPVVIVDNLEKDKINWSKIEFSAWIECEPAFEDTGIFLLNDSKLAFTSSSTNKSDAIGSIPASIPVAVVDQEVAVDRIWCQIKSQGYVINNIEGENGVK